MAERRRKPAGPAKPAKALDVHRRATTMSASAQRRRRFGPGSPFVALLLRAIRDGDVHDWASLTNFQVKHDLDLVQWGTLAAGRPPAVDVMLASLRYAGLVTVEGISFKDDVWVRRDDVDKAPPGMIVYDPRGLDPDNRLGSDVPLQADGIKIRLTPLWPDIQDVLGISLGAVAALQSPRARVVEPDVFPEPTPGQDYPDVFVIMPFDEAMRPIYDDHIASVCRKLSLSVGRGDDFFNAHAVMADIWGAIQHAKVIVADCTGRNANVFYEMGLAHVLGKPVVLLSQHKSDIPFDIGSIRYIPYEYTPHGMKEFEETLRQAIVASIE
jgi:hypothetical protein